MSRPETPIDWKKVDELLQSGCNGAEIAAFYGIHQNTFYDRVAAKYNMSFTQYLTLKRSHGDALIREAQYNKAVKKLDNTMLIWLGKQRLGQKENHYDNPVPEEIVKQFDTLLAQVDMLRQQNQSSNNIDSNISNEPQS